MNLLNIALYISLSGLVLAAWYFGYTTGRVAQLRAEHRRWLERESYLIRQKIHHARHRRQQSRGDWGGQN